MFAHSYFRLWPTFTIFLGLSLLWEAGQLPFYTLWRHGNWQTVAYAVAHCTIGDGLIAVATALATFAAFRFTGVQSSSHRALIGFVLLAMVYTVFSERLNVQVRGSWAYSDLMPLVPLLGTGLTPLLQWIIVPVLTWFLAGEPVTSKTPGRPPNDRRVTS